MMRRLRQLLAATLLAVAATAVVPMGPAAAAACGAGTGVSVVVNNDVRCGASGGSAMSSFRGVGHSVQDYRGFVCRIDGAPADPRACDGYAPADAYWGLFWSDGKSGTWVYSSEGAATLDVPKGGWVAFVWQNSDTKRYPSMRPVSAAPAPAPTTKAPKPARTSAAAGATTPSPSASPSTAAEKKQAAKKKAARQKAKAEKKKAAAAATATPTPVEPATSEADLQKASDSSESTGGLWAGAAIAIALLAGMGGLLWRRKVAGGSS